VALDLTLSVLVYTICFLTIEIFCYLNYDLSISPNFNEGRISLMPFTGCYGVEIDWEEMEKGRDFC
jgi:hypothetical protein